MNETLPDPIIVPPSEYWDGNDGPWSSFFIRVGTPPQYLRALVSTTATYSWVVLPEGCLPAEFNSSICADTRGKVFDISKSTTWKDQGNGSFFELGLETNLGYVANGDFALETLGIGLQDLPSVGGPNLTSQVVAGISATNFFLGGFGLGTQPTNLTQFGNPITSFITSLRDRRLIPSLSWAYTAGAKYRLKGVFGSLTIGGYDRSHFSPNNVSFAFADDISRDLVVGVQSIETQSEAGGKISLLPSGILAFVDSTVPHIWLPVESCRAFEGAFGLTWNEILELYTVNNSLHDSLLSRNASLTFKLGNKISGGSSVGIVLPYSSFDLTLSPPLVAESTKYFPLKRADNATQYTLGRTFLQETYLIADYERKNFSISQAVFNDGGKADIVPILPLNYTPSISGNHTGDAPRTGGPLNRSAIAGVILGPLVLLFLLVIFWGYRRYKLPGKLKKDLDSDEEGPIEETPSIEEAPPIELPDPGLRAEELPAGLLAPELEANEQQVTPVRVELPGDPPPPVELSGDSVSGRSGSQLPLAVSSNSISEQSPRPSPLVSPNSISGESTGHLPLAPSSNSIPGESTGPMPLS